MRKRNILILLCTCLIGALTVGATLAYLLAEGGQAENVFTPAYVSCAVSEDGYTGDGNTQTETTSKSNVRIENTGNIPAYIRAYIVINWKNEDGTGYAQTPVENTDYSLQLAQGTGWFFADGAWYFSEAVAPQMLTDVLITSCQVLEGANAPENAHLSVEIVATAVQATVDAVEAWSNGAVTATENGAPLTQN